MKISAQIQVLDGKLAAETGHAVTTISYRKELSDIKNLHDLPPETVKFLQSKVEYLESRGFQELNGYQGRQGVISMGGHWTSRGPDAKFVVTSYGTGDKDFGIPKQWSKHS